MAQHDVTLAGYRGRSDHDMTAAAELPTSFEWHSSRDELGEGVAEVAARLDERRRDLDGVPLQIHGAAGEEDLLVEIMEIIVDDDAQTLTAVLGNRAGNARGTEER